MEIRIPMADATKFDLLATSMEEENVKVNINQTHGRRDGTLAIRATLTPAKPIEESRKYRAMGTGYIHPRNGGQGHTFPKAVFAVCFHGHYAFMDKLFNAIPEAKLQSSMTRRVNVPWMTAANFKDTAHQIGQENFGSMVEPRAFDTKCECLGLPKDHKAETVKCAYCDDTIDKDEAFYGDKGTNAESEPLCETCYYEDEPVATIIFNGDEEEAQEITGCRNETDGVFTASFVHTDAWRGYYTVKSDDYTEIDYESILWGEHDEELIEKKKKLNEIFQTGGIEYVFVISRTSNLFAQGWDTFVKNGQVEDAKKLLEAANVKARPD